MHQRQPWVYTAHTNTQIKSHLCVCVCAMGRHAAPQALKQKTHKIQNKIKPHFPKWELDIELRAFLFDEENHAGHAECGNQEVDVVVAATAGIIGICAGAVFVVIIVLRVQMQCDPAWRGVVDGGLNGQSMLFGVGGWKMYTNQHCVLVWWARLCQQQQWKRANETIRENREHSWMDKWMNVYCWMCIVCAYVCVCLPLVAFCVNVRTDHRHRMRFFRIVYIITTQSHARLGFLYILNYIHQTKSQKVFGWMWYGRTKNNIT